MLGIRGLDSFGLVHGLIGLAALGLGCLMFVQSKGTRRHRHLGRAYVGTMVLLNVTGLSIYDLTGRFGPFHIAALVSLLTLGAGVAPVLLRRPPGQWAAMHGIFMSWSYVGLLAAFISEVATRVPGVGFGLGATLATVLAVAGGAFLIHSRVPQLARRFDGH